jgi:hypothetical protein
MRYRKLDQDGDYTFGHSQDDFYRDEPAAVGQAALTRLLLWLGEWFLDTDEGTQYMQGILGKNDISIADTNIQDRISGTESLTDISDFQSSIDPVTRHYSFIATIDTEFGPTQIQKDNYGAY